MGIDLDRGVETRWHRMSGMEVHMYVDEPGVYRSSHGTLVPDAVAAGAGFPVEKLAKEREKRDRQAQAMASIEAQFAKANAGDLKQELVAERAGFKVYDIGVGFNVVDQDGNKMNPRPLPEAIAKVLFEQLAGAEIVAKPVEDEPKAPAE